MGDVDGLPKAPGEGGFKNDEGVGICGDVNEAISAMPKSSDRAALLRCACFLRRGDWGEKLRGLGL